MAAAALPREPPPEAEKLAEGSYTLSLEDGSTVRWTRRPDGTWRRPERTRAGWVGELEQKKYVTPARRAQQEGNGLIPGLPPDEPSRPVEVKKKPIPGLPPDEPSRPVEVKKKPIKSNNTQPEAPKSRTEQRSGAVEKQRAPAHPDKARQQGVQAPIGRSPFEPAPRQQGVQAPIGRSPFEPAPRQQGVQAPIGRSPFQPAPPAANKPVLENVDDVDAAIDLLADRLHMLRIDDRPPAATNQGEEAPVPSSDTPKAATRDKKAIRKKLKQIGELEEKLARGEPLNEAQVAKIRTRVELETLLTL